MVSSRHMPTAAPRSAAVEASQNAVCERHVSADWSGPPMDLCCQIATS
jgi:hypothetical protein